MIKGYKKRIFTSLLLASLIAISWPSRYLAQAQTVDDLGLEQMTASGLTREDPRIVVARIIQVSLGVLGTLGVVLVIYAGFLWMTSQGNQEKIDKAKLILKSAGIGLLIILLSFAIVSFIISRLVGAVGGSNGPSDPSNPNIPPSPPIVNFLIVDFSPANNSVNLPRNTVARFKFNGSVDPQTVNSNSVNILIDQQSVDGQWLVQGQEIIFQPTETCLSNCGEVNCWPENATISITVDQKIKSLGQKPKALDCSGINSCSLSFKVSSNIDCQDPQAEFLNNIGFCSGVNNNVDVLASDDSGLAYFELLVDDQLTYSTTGSFGKHHIFQTNWTPSLDFNEQFVLQATVKDFADRQVIVRQTGHLLPAHCCNGEQDGDEEGIDCGGSCLSCSGSACAIDQQQPADSCNNNLCRSGFCTQQGSTAEDCLAAGYPAGTENCCLCKNQPKISAITPQGGFCSNDYNQYCYSHDQCGEGFCDTDTPNASPGNLVTITGGGFGDESGSVIFHNQKLGNLSVCDGQTWSNNQIIVQVPTGVTSGSLQVKNKDGFVATSPQELLINTISRPGLCSLNKTSGVTNEVIEYSGVNFSSTINNPTTAWYGNLTSSVPGNEPIVLSPIKLTALVPNLQPIRTTTFVRDQSRGNLGPVSNFLYFNKEVDPSVQPQISSFNPSSGPPKQYVTILGQGFGHTRGTSRVLFGNIEASYSFPSECADSVWSDQQIIVKVPEALAVGSSQVVSIELASGVTITADGMFTVNNQDLAPSVCRLSPSTGPSNSLLKIWGEYFGSQNSETSRVKFSSNVLTQANYWSGEGLINEVTTIVPVGAVSGPVKITTNNQESNGLNFRVGNCQKDSDCLGQVCCSDGQCRDNCYGTVDSCVYRWSFTTESNQITCPEGTTICGNDCCNSSQICQNNTCQDRSLLSCSSYDKCGEGGLYCPNSPGWCSLQLGEDSLGRCGDNYCQELFRNKGFSLDQGHKIYYKDNRCFDYNQPCSFEREVFFKEISLDTSFKLKCQDGHWVTNPVNGQCPFGQDHNGEDYESKFWKRLDNGTCQSLGNCFSCSNLFQCLKIGNNSYCGIKEDICPANTGCNGEFCSKKIADCECCCDVNLNDSVGYLGNPGCCAPLVCDGVCGSGSGSQGQKFGYCSGCALVGGSIDDRDAACNCVGHKGKYCNTSTHNGYCSDCSLLEKEDCLGHKTCCYDVVQGQCRGVVDGNRISGGINDGMCGYYSCDDDVCSNEVSVDGQFASLRDCQSNCEVSILQGQPCYYSINYPGSNSIGCNYEICSAPLACLPQDRLKENDCGVCCCDPAYDKCSQINSKLHCLANQESCSGPNRGLCCGCQQDLDCGNYKQNGCGYDTCCQARPTLKDVVPGRDLVVCRNSLIRATFNQPIDPESVNDNVHLIVNYKNQSCPDGTIYLASQLPQNWWSRLGYRLLSWLRPSATADKFLDSNYCSFPKQVSVIKNDLIIRPLILLPSSSQVFVVLVTDNNLEDDQRVGLLSQAGIGLRGRPVIFNNLSLDSAQYWQFRTSDQVCKINHLEVQPASILFSNLQEQETVLVKAISSSGDELYSVPDLYEWQWQWLVNNPAVAQLGHQENEFKNTVKPKNKKDAETSVQVIARITKDTLVEENQSLAMFSQSVPVRVFLCANPWPARQSDGSWKPWIDPSTNMQFYYCRDGEGDSQINDLSGLKVVTSTDNEAIGPAYYFFRYDHLNTAPTGFKAMPDPVGQKLNLSWNSYSGVIGYKIYYGLRSGQYFSEPIVLLGNETSVVVDNLINDQSYYFTISALVRLDTTTVIESPLAPEIIAKPTDTIGPAMVNSLIGEIINDNQIKLKWRPNNDDTVAYRVEYWVSSNETTSGTGQVRIVAQPATGGVVAIIIDGLLNVRNIVAEVKAVDASGNLGLGSIFRFD